MEQSPASVIITDPEGRIEYVNPKFTQVSGYTFEEVKQKNPRVLKSGEADPEFYEQLWKTIKSGGEWTGEFHNRKKNGELYWELASISPIKNRAGEITHFVCVKEDITARRAMEEALRASEEQLRQAQKMESIGTLAGGIAHDFNNILTGILGFTDLAMAEASTAGPAHSHLQQIRQLADRAAALTRQLLTFARRQVLDRECINLNDSVTALSTFLRRVIGEVIDLQLDLAGDLKNVDVDVSQMDQVLVNLCVNARDAMPGGGRLIISTRNVQFKPADVHLPPEAEPGAYVLLAVSDTGIGMDNATRERIFEPFFSTKAVGRGSGLGLSTAYGIIRQQCGSISVQSQPG
ncbi:MAG: PAS domain S-box protein, partial [Acidobacteria bacterium]|nr:PAS domain S-box protein [Acidobacteriota bacterium]